MINRFFSENNFKRLREDFKFLVPIIKSFKGELEFSIRDNYFNLYFRGNSAAKVVFKPDGKYKIDIHHKFFPASLGEDKRFSYNNAGLYCEIETNAELLHPLLQKKYLDEIFSNIKKENYSEELTLEQMIITDNTDRDDLILIDRQVTDPDISGRMDLLALKQQDGNKYQFLILEVKMGNNSELKESVARQLQTYVDHISAHFEEYKKCYEMNYYQKKILGLITKPETENIEIVPNVAGAILVGGYSGLAKEKIMNLAKKYPQIKIQTFRYDIRVS